MRKYKDLTNYKFGLLTVIKQVEHASHGKKWLCSCDCGNTKTVHSSNLSSGSTKSCGCYRTKALTSHGLSNKRTKKGHELYQVWTGMRSRCNNPNSDKFKYYGARGISVCERWSDFIKFIEDMGDRPKGSTLDRVNNDGNYEPSNCRWASITKQANNKRNTLVEIDGIKKSFKQWCEINDLNYGTAKNRVSIRGWCKACACTKPVGEKAKCEH